MLLFRRHILELPHLLYPLCQLRIHARRNPCSASCTGAQACCRTAKCSCHGSCAYPGTILVAPRTAIDIRICTSLLPIAPVCLHQRFLDLIAQAHIFLVFIEAPVCAEGDSRTAHTPARGSSGHGLLAGADRTGIQQELHIVKVGVIDPHGTVEVIGILVAGRIVAHLLAVLRLFLLGTALVDVQIHIQHLIQANNIRVGGRIVSGIAHHESPGILIQDDPVVLADASGGIKGSERLLVLLPVGELLLNLLHRAASAFGKPWRKLRRTVLAEISVRKLPVSQKANLLAADITVFLIKKSHNTQLLSCFSCILISFPTDISRETRRTGCLQTVSPSAQSPLYKTCYQKSKPASSYF